MSDSPSFSRWYYLAVFVVVAGGVAAIAWATVSQMATPRLHQAVRKGDSDAVGYWAAMGGDVHFTGHGAQQRQPLHEAALAGWIDVVRTLLEHGAAVDARDAYRQTPLMFAAWAGHREIVALLLEHGADLNAQAFDGMTPLYGAVSRGRNRCAQLLLDHGADPNRATNSYSLISVAVRRGDAELVEAIVGAGGRADAWALGSALRRGDRRKLRALLNAVDRGASESLPLNQWMGDIVRARRVDIAASFLCHGASPDVHNGRGNTLLHLAAAEGDIEMIRRLLCHGAKIDETNRWGETAEDVAVSAGHLHCAAVLHLHGHEPAGRETYGLSSH